MQQTLLGKATIALFCLSNTHESVKVMFLPRTLTTVSSPVPEDGHSAPHAARGRTSAHEEQSATTRWQSV